jgi:hypothetical protein
MEGRKVMKYTHQKRPYKGECIQWDGTNTAKVLEMCDDAQLWGANSIMVRHKDGVSTLFPYYWIVRKENGKIQCYDERTFNIKYEALPPIIG